MEKPKMTFDKITISETLHVIDQLQAVAAKIRSEVMAAKYSGLRTYLLRHDCLSNAQCKIIAKGCDLNKIDPPFQIAQGAIAAGYKPKRKPVPPKPPRNIFAEFFEQVDVARDGMMATAKALNEIDALLDEVKRASK